ncbi:MAG TPA: hypothetical protein DCY07_05720 [Rhodospirillaceae bacterium]|nr:hypothetical protein [Rhodospirillaceae bacterium]
MSNRRKDSQTDSEETSNQILPTDQYEELLATVRHDLRQPLQTLNLIQGILESKINDVETLKVVSRLGNTLDSMTGLLDALLDTEKQNVQDDDPEKEPNLATQSFAEEKPISSSSDAGKSLAPVVFIVDDDLDVRVNLSGLLTIHNHSVEAFESSEQFLSVYRSGSKGCLLIDAMLPGISGLDLIKQLRSSGDQIPAIMITGNGDIALAVQSMKIGASDFIEKPIDHNDLLTSVTQALRVNEESTRSAENRDAAIASLARLSPRERQIMERVLAGDPSKNIAADLGISQRTVETHRANIMKKTRSKSLPALLKIALLAA